MPRSRCAAIASVNPATVRLASPTSAAFSKAAFSRSRRPMRPKVARQSDGDAGAFLGQGSLAARSILARRVDRREDRGDRDGADAAVADLPRRPPHADLVERHDRPAVVIVPAFEHEHLAADRACEILRPIAERRQRGRGRQPDAHRGDPAEPLALHHRVDKMRRPDLRRRRSCRAPPRDRGRAAPARLTMPPVTSAVVGTLTACTTVPPST